MTCDITSMYSKYVLGKLQICNLVRFIILYSFYETKIMSLNNKLQLFFSSAFLIVGGILSINGKALDDDDDDNTSLPDPIQGIAEATGIEIR